MVAALLLAAALLQAAQQPATHHVEAPLAQVPLPRVGFACMTDGLPVLRMDSSGARDIWYNQSGDPRVVFLVNNPTGTAAYDGDEHDGRYLLTINGTSVGRTGVADGIPVRIELTIRVVANRITTADYFIQAGAFTRRETNCGTMPMPAQPARTTS